MSKNFRSLNQVLACDKIWAKHSFESTSLHPEIHPDISGDNYPLAIGFHITMSSSEENYYLQTILNWMTIKVGEKEVFNGNKLHAVFTDEESFPIYLSEEDFKFTPIDGVKRSLNNIGWRPFRYEENYIKPPNMIIKFVGAFKPKSESLSDLVKKEIERLDQIWEKVNLDTI